MEPARQPQQSAGTEALQRVLDDLHAAARDVEGSLVVSRDGLTMAAQGVHLDVDRAGAVCTQAYALSGTAAAELQRGEPQEVLLKAAGGYVLVAPAGPEAKLAVLARPDANLGLVFLEARRAAHAVAAVFAGDT
jgi:predicted regulator of Ras-like GTPase activity (Roadblock/LC7/MglB family)